MALEIFRLVGSVFVDTDAAEKSLKKTDDKASGLGATLLGGIKTAAKWAARLTAAAAAVATGVGVAAGKALESYADYEQLVGGVETLFEDSAETVIKNAEKAYKTAGMTANTYMETVTGFAASLLQSLGGDTVAAAEYADMAITDMSDNANKMGTSIDLIQNAYQGFAKQNYTMLDNLKLGYGGTKEEMQRLLEDATALSGIEYDISSYADVVDAIHVIQTEMGITGTTAKEATSTLSGSINTIKGKLQNLVTHIGGALAPAAQSVLSLALDALPTVEGWVNNLIPAISSGIETVVEWISSAGEKFQAFKGWLQEIGDYAGDKLSPLISDLSAVFDTVKAAIDNVVTSIKEYFTSGEAAEDATNFLKDAIDFLAEAYEAVSGAVDDCLVWLQDMGSYIAEAFTPAADDLTAAFGYVEEALVWLQEAIQPVIDALVEYFTSGEAAEDITNLIKDAVDLLSGAYSGIKDFILDIVQGFKDMVTWGQENQTLLGLIAIAVGTLTAAIVAYNIAQAIKNAGGIVEIAQLAATAIGLGALTVAETAHTVAATIGTAVTTAFGAAMAFLTSPITLVVLAIGALIAIIYLLVTNWDTVKEAAVKCWDWIKATWNKVADWFNTNVIQPISNFFSGLWVGIKNIFSGVGTWFKNIFTGAVTGVKNAWSGIKSWFSGLLDGVKSVFSTVATAVGNIFKSPINGIIDGINAFIRGLNKIKIPDWVPSVGGMGFNISELPKLEEGAVLEKGQTGFLEGNGAEAVVPLHKNKKWISAVAQDMDSTIGGSSSDRAEAILMDILSALEELAQMQVTLDTDKVVGALAKPMDKKLGQIQAQKARA